MATYNVQHAKHATLSVSTVDTVVLSGCHAGIIRVRNRATSGDPIYFRVYDESAPTKTAPTVTGDDTYVVPFSDLCDIVWPGGVAHVMVISASAHPYSVESIPGLN